MSMPKINLTGLTEDEKKLAKGIINSRTGELRASKPNLPKKVKVEDKTSFYGSKYVYKNEDDRDKGRTAYIWRMVSFFVSPISQHSCMPCTADFWLEGTAKEAREEAKMLDEIVKKIVDNVPVTEQYGTARWGKALGYF